MANGKLLRTVEAAAQLNVHRSTLTRLVQDREIKPATRGEGVRGEMFFYASEIARYKRRRDEAQGIVA